MRELTHITVVYNKNHPDFKRLSTNPFEPLGIVGVAPHNAITGEARLLEALERIAEAMSMGEVKHLIREAGI